MGPNPGRVGTLNHCLSPGCPHSGVCAIPSPVVHLAADMARTGESPHLSVVSPKSLRACSAFSSSYFLLDVRVTQHALASMVGEHCRLLTLSAPRRSQVVLYVLLILPLLAHNLKHLVGFIYNPRIFDGCFHIRRKSSGAVSPIRALTELFPCSGVRSQSSSTFPSK